MRYKFLLLLLSATVLISCKKERLEEIVSPPAQPVLLKDVLVERLPSPYYHFEYNASGAVTFASFASGFNRYDVLYSGGRITEMRNNIIVNKDRLQYSYDNAGRVSTVTYADSAGTVYTRMFLTYEGQSLVKIIRQRKDAGGGFSPDKLMLFSYYPDGNLDELTYDYLPRNGSTEAVFTDKFAEYDDKTNVDGFGLIHDEFFDHLVLLPQVKLQKNNPRKESRSGDGVNYAVTYNYTYNGKGLPTVKQGDFVYLNGTEVGQHVPISSSFTYYD